MELPTPLKELTNHKDVDTMVVEIDGKSGTLTVEVNPDQHELRASFVDPESKTPLQFELKVGKLNSDDEFYDFTCYGERDETTGIQESYNVNTTDTSETYINNIAVTHVEAAEALNQMVFEKRNQIVEI
jgi:hypothetical protein